jgi:hypothetical protein
MCQVELPWVVFEVNVLTSYVTVYRGPSSFLHPKGLGPAARFLLILSYPALRSVLPEPSPTLQNSTEGKLTWSSGGKDFEEILTGDNFSVYIETAKWGKLT